MHAVMHSLRALTLAGIFVVCASCTAPVHHDMTEASANEVVAALTLRGFAADKAASGTGSWDVVVPRTQRRAAVQVLAGAGLPRAPLAESAPEREGGLVPSEDADRERRRRALEREVSATLAALPDVREARVHLTIPRPPDRLSRTATAPAGARASVLLVYRSGDEAPAEAAVRALVAGAVDGLDPASISVVTATVDVPPPPTSTVVSLGPLVVAEESLGLLRLIVWTGGGFILALAASLVVATGRLRGPQ